MNAEIPGQEPSLNRTIKPPPLHPPGLKSAYPPFHDLTDIVEYISQSPIVEDFLIQVATWT